MILHALNHEVQGPNVRGVADAVRMLTGVEGFEPPCWEAFLEGARPPPRDPPDHEPGGTRGWQHEAASRVERNFRDRKLMSVMSRRTGSVTLTKRSDCGHGPPDPTLRRSPSALSRISPQLFRVLLLRRLRLPLPLCSRACRCGRLLRCFASSRRVFQSRGVGKTGIRCRECCNQSVPRSGRHDIRDMYLAAPEARVGRRIEIVADGPPVWRRTTGSGCHTCLPLHCDGSPMAGADVSDGAVLVAARRSKERTYPDLVGPHARVCLVVLAGEVGGRWSHEVSTIVRLLARAKAMSEPSILRRRAEQAWWFRWGTILVCSAARAFAPVGRAERGRLRPISTSASFFFAFRQLDSNFDFGQCRLRPIFGC